jgi:hypothetical protein
VTAHRVVNPGELREAVEGLERCPRVAASGRPELNDQGFQPPRLIRGFPGAATFTSPEFLIPAGTTSMTVYFEGMARVKAGDARMTEGAHFESVSTRGSLKIYNRVVKHQDGSLSIHAWDSNEAHNFDFLVPP